MAVSGQQITGWQRSIWVLLAVVVAVELSAGRWIDGPEDPVVAVYRALHLLEMVALIALVVGTIGPRSAVSRLIGLGLMCSLIGDFINSHLLSLEHVIRPQTLLSIPPFTLAHLAYMAAFVRLLRAAGERAPSRASVIGLLLVWPWVAVGLWSWMIHDDAPERLRQLSLAYAFVVTLMGLLALMLGARLGHAARLPAIGGVLFVVSDSLIGLFLLDGPARPLWASQAIWISYFAAQCLIAQAGTIPPRSGQGGAAPRRAR